MNLGQSIKKEDLKGQSKTPYLKVMKGRLSVQIPGVEIKLTTHAQVELSIGWLG